MAELPGNVHKKIGDLRIEKGLTKKQVRADQYEEQRTLKYCCYSRSYKDNPNYLRI